MKIGITHRLFLAILTAALLSVGSLAVIMQWNLDRGFLRYVNTLEQARLSRLATALEQRYAAAGNWYFFKVDPEEWRRLVAASQPDDLPGSSDRQEKLIGKSRHQRDDGNRPPVPPRLMRGFMQRTFLLDSNQQPVIAPSGRGEQPELTPLHVDGKVAGYLGIMPHKRLSDERQLRFLKEQKTAFVLVAALILLLAAVLSLLLSSRLLRPLRALASATNSLAAGNFTIRVPITSGDELGQLARDFNALALSLEQTEQARRGWVADISHELRTPLAVLQGEVEALQDGIRPLNREALDSLHGEILRLGRLVTDLYQLSLSDLGALTYRKEKLDLVELVRNLAGLYSEDFATGGLDLQLDLPETASIVIFADAARLQQLFANLLGNSLKYTDPGGIVTIRMKCASGTVTVDIEDSAPGVATSDLDRLFDRLYRVESSRNRAGGGAGLGLAICSNIATAHEGSINAAQSPLGGIRIQVVLPLLETS